MKRVAILSDDERYMNMIPKLLHANWQIHLLHEVESLGHVHVHPNIHHLPFEELAMIILPVNGLDRDDRLTIAGKLFVLSAECLRRIPSSCVLYTGLTSPALMEMKNMYSLTVVPFFTLDEVAIYNAIPTAEGALMLAMKHTKRTIHEANVLVFGLGRVGQTVCRLFAAAGAHVTLVSIEASELAWAKVYGMKAIHLDDMVLWSDYAIIINTIPAPIITNQMLQKMRKDVLLIDLASMPGGIEANAAYASRRHIIHALSLPAKVAPMTASDIIYRAIMDKEVK